MANSDSLNDNETLKDKRDYLVLRIRWRLQYLEIVKGFIREQYQIKDRIEKELAIMEKEVRDLELLIDDHYA